MLYLVRYQTGAPHVVGEEAVAGSYHCCRRRNQGGVVWLLIVAK